MIEAPKERLDNPIFEDLEAMAKKYKKSPEFKDMVSKWVWQNWRLLKQEYLLWNRETKNVLDKMNVVDTSNMPQDVQKARQDLRKQSNEEVWLVREEIRRLQEAWEIADDSTRDRAFEDLSRR